MDDVEINIGGDSSEIEAAIADTANALARLAKVTSDTAKQFRKLEHDTDGAEDSVKRQGRSAKDSAKNLDALKFGAQAAGGRVGEMAGRVENAVRALTSLGGPAGIAVAGAAAVVGLAAAAAATTYAMVKLTRAGGEAVDALKPLQGTSLGLSAEQVAAIESANTSLDGVVKAGQRLVAEIAANIAPSVEQLSRVLIAMGLAATDAFNDFADGTSIVTTAIDAMGRAFGTFVEAEAGWLKAWRLLRQALGDTDTSGLDAQIDSLDRLAATLETGVSAALADVLDQMLDLDRADEFIARLGVDYEAAAKNAEAYAAVVGKLHALTRSYQSDTYDGETRIQMALSDRMEAIEAIRAELEKLGQAENARFFLHEAGMEATLRAERELAAFYAEQQAARLAAASQELGIIAAASNQLTAVLVANAKKKGDADEDAQRRAQLAAIGTFRAGQLAAGAQVVVDTLRNAVALAAPPPVGLGPIAGPLFATLQGGAAGVAIAAQPPPSFDIGGTVTGGLPVPGGQAGQVMVQAQEGEVFLTRRDQADLMAGMGGGTTEVILKVGNRTVERMLVENANAGGTASRYRRSTGVHQRRYRG